MVHTLADITGNGSAQKLATKRTPANWISFTIPVNQSTGLTTNTAAVRVGEANVSATQGTAVPVYGLLFPSMSDSQYLDLSQIYVFLVTNDKVQITYGVL